MLYILLILIPFFRSSFSLFRLFLETNSGKLYAKQLITEQKIAYHILIHNLTYDPFAHKEIIAYLKWRKSVKKTIIYFVIWDK